MEFPGGLVVKDPVLSLLQFGSLLLRWFDPWPGTSTCHRHGKKKKKKKKMLARSSQQLDGKNDEVDRKKRIQRSMGHNREVGF